MTSSQLSLPPPALSAALLDLDRLEAEGMRRRFPDFIRGAWHVLEPSSPYLHNWHIDCVGEHLEAVTAGEITRLLINLPTRCMKSLETTVMWPAWEWITRPSTRWMFASYSAPLSTKLSVDRRTLIQSKWYQDRWGDRFKFTTDQNVKTEYANDKRGAMVATGFEGSATGKGGGRIVIDDPHNPERALSDTQRETDLRIFDQTLSSRLDNPKEDAIVVVMQRLHEKDISARCKELGYVHLKLPQEAPERVTVTFPRSGRKVERAPGDLLWPDRFGRKEVAGIKSALGSYGYACQQQQEPLPAGGGVFKREHWQRFTAAPDDVVKIISVDAAFKDNTDSDFVAIEVLGASGIRRFVHYTLNERMSFGATVSAIRDIKVSYPEAIAIVIEDKANGPAIINVLKKEIPNVQEYTPKGSKLARAQAYQPQVEAGSVFVRDGVPWAEPFFAEFSAFRGKDGDQDNQIDAWSQGMDWFANHSLSVDEIEHEARAERGVW